MTNPVPVAREAAPGILDIDDLARDSFRDNRVPHFSLPGSTPAWNWYVEAKGSRSRTDKVISPATRIECRWLFHPEYSGIYSLRVPVTLSGLYSVTAAQAAGGGRRAMARIRLISRVSHRDSAPEYSSTIFERQVTKSTETGPFEYTYMFQRDVDAWAGITPEETLDRDVSLYLRVELLAYARWHRSRSLLDFRKPTGQHGIRFGKCDATLELAKPRPGEQRPPT